MCLKVTLYSILLCLHIQVNNPIHSAQKTKKFTRYTDTGKLKNLDDIISVTKFERRYEPGL